MKKIIGIILAAVMLLPLAACGGSRPSSSAKPQTSGIIGSDNASVSDNTNSDQSQQFFGDSQILSVVHPDFKLTNGFIEPVEQQSQAPEGYIPISTAQEFDKIRLNTSANYILMSDIDLSAGSWKIITKTFSGILNGNGYTVSVLRTHCFGILNREL